MRFLLSYLPITLTVLLVLVAGTVAYVVILFKRAKAAGAKAEPEPGGTTGEATEEPARDAATSRRGKSLELRAAFEHGFARLKRQAFGKDHRYGVPWLLMLGQAGSRRNDLLARAGLGLPWGAPAERELASEIGCRWWFFDRGLVIDLAGEYVLREDGDTSDRLGWRNLLRLLQRYRPKRPIDGIVLTISCDELRQMGRVGDRPAVEAEQKAKLLYEKLRDAQRTLGLRYPVYVLVTGCEGLTGFPSLAGELPERLRGEIFGWSSPYSVETAYRTEWLDEAFSQLRHRVDQVLLEMFAQTSEVQEPDDAFLFPDDLASLKEPLRVYLNQLFQPIAYHESMLFRGVYFCGADRPGSPAREPAADTAGEAARTELGPAGGEPLPTYFLKDLFEKKVFREAGLGGPTGATLVQKNRKLRFAWVGLGLLTLLVGLGLYTGYRHLAERGQQLKTFLDRTADDVRRLRSSSIVCGEAARARQQGSRVPRVLTEAERATLVDGATRFLAALGDLDASKYRSPAIPYSWFSPFNSDLEAAFIEAYDVILFKALCRELENQAERTVLGFDETRGQIGGRLLLGGGGAMRLSTPLQELPDFENLEEYLQALTALEENVQRYNSLKRTQSLDDLRDLVRFLFSEELPSGFLRKADLYEAALEKVAYEEFQLAPYRRDANRRARELIDQLHRSLFEDSPLVLSIWALSERMEGLAIRRWTLSDETKLLRDLVDEIDRVDRGLSEPNVQWLFREPFDLGPDFDRIHAMVNGSSLLELEGARSLSQQVYADGEERWRRLRGKLQSIDGSGLTGELFEVGQNGLPIQLSADVKVLQTTLDVFLNQPFMRAGGAQSLQTSGLDLSRNRVRWEVGTLEQAVDTYEPYRQFVETGLDFFPALRPTLSLIARRQLNSTLIDRIRQSQVLASIPEILSVTPRVRERLLGEEIDSFKEAQEPLTQLLGILDDAGLRDTREELRQLLAAQSLELLQEVDELLGEEALYRPKGGSFGWWDGSSELALAAYAVKDVKELDEYLARQRERLEELAALARPLGTMLSSTGDDSDPLPRWEVILDQLDRYDDKQPDNSVAGLEELIRTDLAGVALENCFEKTSAVAGVGGSPDYFRNRSSELQEQLYRRCSQLAGERAADNYEQLARFFNLRLADRYPFAATESDLSPVEADPEALREFFRQFDEKKAVILGVPESSRAFGVAGRKVRDFISRMSDVRALLAPFLEDTSGRRSPTVDFEVEFRVHQELEAYGDQVIDWRLTVGQQKIRRPTRSIVTWTLGDPVDLELRWATGSRWKPARHQENRQADVVEKTVNFRYKNRWSLIKFLRAHPTSRGERLTEDERPRTLEFEIVMDPDPEAPNSEPALAGPVVERRARMFMHIIPVDPETKEPLTLPDFPTRAPDLRESVTAQVLRP